MSATPPRPEQRPHKTSHHGQTREDPFHWLRAENWQEVMSDPETLKPDIRAYLEAENAYTKHQMADTETLQTTLFEELKGRIKQDDSSVPEADGPFEYYIAYVEGGQHPQYCRRPRGTDEHHILLDGNELAKDRAYFQFGAITHSPDHQLLAWTADTNGSEDYTLTIRDLATGKDGAETIEKTTGNVCWAADKGTLYYVRRDDNHRPAFVHRHLIGTDSEDELIYREEDPGFFLNIGKTQSGNYVAINASGHETSEWHLLDAKDPAAKPQCVAARQTGHEYELEEAGGTLYILTNQGGAEDFKIVTSPIAGTDPANWQDLIPHQAGSLILSLLLFQDYLIRMVRKDGLPRIIIRELVNGTEHTVAFEEEAYALGISPGHEFITDTLRFSYSSMTTPSEVYDYDLKTRARTLRKRQQIPSGHNREAYVTRRIFAPAHDGEQIPVTLLYRKDTPLDGSAPLYLYGYGSYGISMPAGFYANHLSLVDRGFIYAIAHIRGGKEKGYAWYKNGKMEKKTNTFKDFISTAEHLINENYTAKGAIIAHGGSAGGMLMGAVANMSPELFAGMIAEVPFVDVLNTMLDASLPLTPPEWPEWGNPIESKEAFDHIKSYSPYDNVAPMDYPAMLVVAGLTDPRVTYWEPAKWVAKLRTLKTDDNPLLLKTNMEAGHGGASGRFDHLKEVAFTQSFALKRAGRHLASGQPANPGEAAGSETAPTA